MNFIKEVKINFETISDTRTVLISAEKSIVITSIRCTNISNDNIRVFLEDIRLLQSPIEKAYICYNLLISANQTTDLLMVSKGQSSQIAEHKLLDGDNLVCYSNSVGETFSCIVNGYELVET
jgi:hypothetical protein